MTNIEKTEAFLKETFDASPYLTAHPEERAYRLEHSYRVANIGRTIALQEGFDPEEMVIACLLHDISYCQELVTREQRREHGRLSAAIARPFLQQLGLAEDRIGEICFGIAIHVDNEADFAGEHTPFAETVSDADNIDRFDAYRIYETLHYQNFKDMTLAEKQQKVSDTMGRLKKFKTIPLGTSTATELWNQRLDYYLSFYEKLDCQLKHSISIL